MFGFLKKLFGGDAETNQAAGIQIEQVPYKVEPPVVENKVAVANAQPIVKDVAAAEPVKAKTARAAKPKSPTKAKPAKAAAKKPAAKRKPKSTT